METIEYGILEVAERLHGAYNLDFEEEDCNFKANSWRQGKLKEAEVQGWVQRRKLEETHGVREGQSKKRPKGGEVNLTSLWHHKVRIHV
jgi:hypothetical protein